MCLMLNLVKVYKVLKPNFISPYKDVQWPKNLYCDELFISDRTEPLTIKELSNGIVHRGLYFYRSLEDCMVEPGLIVVECKTSSIIAVTERECVAMDCWVGGVVRGMELVELYEKNNWISVPASQPYFVWENGKLLDLRDNEEWKKCI